MYKYNSRQYVAWRNKVYHRDRYTCRLCGSRGGELNAHHIKRKADYPSLAYQPKNGITLCVKCHDVITGNEGLFSMFFSKIVSRDLTLDYVYSFFAHLVEQYSDIVQQLKAAKKWLLIPQELTKQIKSNGTTKRSKDTQRRTGRKKVSA